MARQNLAYDLSIYEPKPVEERPKIEVLEQPNGSKRHKISALEWMQMIGVVSIMVTSICLLLYHNAKINELTMEISKVNEQYQLYLSENQRLSAEIEGKMSLRNVEEIATGSLGLSVMEAYQVEYVDRGTGDIIILTADSPTQSTAGKLGDSIASVMEYLRIVFNKN